VASKRARGTRLAAVVAAAAAAALGGCATSPTGGTPQAIQGASSQVQAFLQQLPPPPPARTWSPIDVVEGFVHASASYASDPAAARAYLTPQERAIWRPAQVTIVSGPSIVPVTYQPHIRPYELAPTSEMKIVDLTGQRRATLTTSGQYLDKPGPSTYKFGLAHINGVWLIAHLPAPRALLLTASDFQWAYQARNLFFFSTALGPLASSLVPDPVYAPLQSASSALNTSLATGLVRGLFNVGGSWLNGATSTAFPVGTKLLRQVTISGRTATVDLGGAAAKASGTVIGSMAEQILTTLSSTAYSPAVATSVFLQINGHVRDTEYTGQDGSPPPVIAGKELYFRTGPSGVSRLAVPGSRPGSRPSPAVLPAEIEEAPITALAASPDASPDGPLLAVATAVGRGCAVSLGSIENRGRITPYRTYQLSRSGGQCTSLSWDPNGNLWAVAGLHIWVLRQGRRPVPVGLPSTAAIGVPISRILELRMAPDGVRAALLIQTSAGKTAVNRLILAAVTEDDNAESFGPAIAAGPGLAPISVSWYNAYNLVVLAKDQVSEVPLTGAAGTVLGPAPAGAQSLTTNGKELVVGASRRLIWTSLTSGSSWFRQTDGAIPTYSG
jgi:hypothetical protein